MAFKTLGPGSINSVMFPVVPLSYHNVETTQKFGTGGYKKYNFFHIQDVVILTGLNSAL